MGNEYLDRLTKRAAQEKMPITVVAEDSSADAPSIQDGIGLNLSDMHILLMMEHGKTIDQHDPICLWVTLNNAYLGEIQKLHAQHNEALTKIITTRTQEYVESVKETTDNFSQVLAQASVEGVRKIFMEHAATLESSKWNARWCAVVVAISALANLIALVA